MAKVPHNVGGPEGQGGAKLTAQQAAFVREYLVDLNGTQAAIRAGYSPKSAASQASYLLRVPKVAAAIAAAQGARAERTEVTADRVLLELSRIGFADLSGAYNEDGTLKLPHEMPADARAALAGLDVEEGEDARVTRKVRSWDKVKALELMGKHLGMFKDKVEVGGADGQALSIVIDMGAAK